MTNYLTFNIENKVLKSTVRLCKTSFLIFHGIFQNVGFDSDKEIIYFILSERYPVERDGETSLISGKT